MDEDTVTIEEMADMHGVAANTIRRILWADQDKPYDEKQLPGAYKVGSKFRGEWRIPRATAEAWQRDPRGRKKSK
ncbi:MAG: hypothetical protein D6712_04720 [Chloroflexi bacterium]|nr:MAG: hypothetical protein D6712_04720 [Chloroflexota bacterium]